VWWLVDTHLAPRHFLALQVALEPAPTRRGVNRSVGEIWPKKRVRNRPPAAEALGEKIEGELGWCVDLDGVGDELQRQGVAKFVEPFERLLEALERRRGELLAASPA